ncbi:MAG: hypothetical protein HS115_11545 [Spirochaetales bacterium]|nr:hypothetical protein [Spirochaetales bacterium]
MSKKQTAPVDPLAGPPPETDHTESSSTPPTPKVRTVIKFSTNWNSKLLCPNFTTVRLHNAKYERGRSYQIEFKQFGFVAHCLDLKTIKASSFNDFISYLDAGMSATKFRSLMQSMYGLITDDRLFDLLLLQRTGPITPRNPDSLFAQQLAGEE